jgi:hypothetical protein
MKTKQTVSCYIYDKYNERGMKNFEKKVKSLLRKNKIFDDAICHNSYMRGITRNNYLKFAEIEVKGEVFSLAEHTHDSQMWDNWENPTPADKRNLFLAVLESKIEDLKIDLYENLIYES